MIDSTLEDLLRSQNTEDVILGLAIICKEGVEYVKSIYKYLSEKYGSFFLRRSDNEKLDLYIGDVNIVLYQDTFSIYSIFVEPLKNCKVITL